MSTFFGCRRHSPRLPLILGLMAALLAALAVKAAAPPAGTQIGNQASASYSDASQITRTVTSNTVITVVQQVASVSLSVNGAKRSTVGAQVQYPHTLVNTGNGTDSFTLSTAQTGAFSFGSAQFYADANGDGVADNTTPITSTGEVPAGGTFNFVVVGTVPGSAVAGNTNTLTVRATSVLNASITTTNTDVTTVTSQAVVNVTKSIDVASGPSPSTSSRTITLTYTNTGNSNAPTVTLTDPLPTGMTYVTNSGRWSVLGATQLTDASGDSQGNIAYDYNSTTRTITAVITNVAAGVSGTVRFQVDIAGSLPAGPNAATANTATYTYNDGTGTVGPVSTNKSQYTVNNSASVSVTGDTVASAAQGATITFTDSVTNTGNATDVIDLTTLGSTFPAGTVFQLFRADGVTPLLDSDNDGIPDTGPLAAGASVNVVIRAVLPTTPSGGGPYDVSLKGASSLDTSQSSTANNRLTTIGTGSVDVTNDTAGGSSPGIGAGPEGSPVKTNTVNPGQTTRFTLVIANNGSVADAYELKASTDPNFATIAVPAGWTVVFKDTNGAIITNTGVINAGQNRTVYADVTPSVTAAGTQDIYFRALSASTNSSDRVHDAVSVNTVRSLTAVPNHTGQVTAGGTIVFAHVITNTGNTLEGDGSLSTIAVAGTTTTTGFTSVIHWDKNNDGVLDPGDPVITDLSALTGGTNGASTAAGLGAGESARLFLKVTAPPGAAAGVSNTATLTLTTTGTINTVAAPAPVVATDEISVIASQLTLVKLQALDAACDGTADTAFSSDAITAGAVPGACIRYQITATNGGGADVTSVVVSDATPTNTVYDATVAASTSVGSVVAPSAGTAGSVQATIGTLTPGQSAVVQFGVKITQ